MLYNVPGAPVDWILHRVGRANAAQTSHHFVTMWNYQLAIAKLLCSQLFFRVFICTFNWGCQSVNAVSLSSFNFFVSTSMLPVSHGFSQDSPLQRVKLIKASRSSFTNVKSILTLSSLISSAITLHQIVVYLKCFYWSAPEVLLRLLCRYCVWDRIQVISHSPMIVFRSCLIRSSSLWTTFNFPLVISLMMW